MPTRTDHGIPAGGILGDALAEYATNIRDWVLSTLADMKQQVGMTDGNISSIDIVCDKLFSIRRLLRGWTT